MIVKERNAQMTERSVTIIKIFFICGMVMSHSSYQGLAPSILAASKM